MKYFPLYFFSIYFFTTFMMAVFGPVIYHEIDVTAVSIYLFFITLSMMIGFYVAVNRPISLPRSDFPKNATEIFPKRLFLAFATVSILGFFITFYIFYTSNQINLDIDSIGQTYNDTYKDYQKNTGSYSLSFIIYSILATPNFFTTIWGIFYFHLIKKHWKTAVIICAFGTPALFTLSAGTQKNIGDILIYMTAILFLKMAVSKNKNLFRNIVTFVIISFSGALALTFILSQRYSSINVDAFNINEKEISLISYNLDHLVFKIFGPDMGLTIAILMGYMTNGYNGLSYALHTPSTWSFMLGSSYSMSVIGERVFNLPSAYLSSYPYLAAIESGWGETRWYSVFSWFASDFTFVGTIPLFGYFAYVYGRTWIESIKFQNPFSIALFCLLTLGVFMAPANNQLMQTPGGLLTLIVTVFLYLRYRKRFNRIPSTYR